MSEAWEGRDESGRYFETPPEMRAVEALLLREVRGRTLDVGCAAGRLALQLQERVPVVAIDSDPTCVEIARARGVRDARCVDVYDLADERFDTIVFAFGTLGMAGSETGLARLLEHVGSLLSPGGCVLADAPVVHGPPHDPEPGTSRLRLRYRRWVGQPFDWLWLDRARLEAALRAVGWACEIVFESQDDAVLLARLTPPAR